jgi:hypothetical protein
VILALKHALMKFAGIPLAEPAPRSPRSLTEPWVKELKAAGYTVWERDGAWHWSLPWRAYSGRYTTERAAWCAADFHYEQQLRSMKA